VSYFHYSHVVGRRRVIPNYFIIEFSERCGQLLEALEGAARKQELLSSAALLIAAAALTIPFVRATESNHPLDKENKRPRDITRAIKKLKKIDFLDAPFLKSERLASFRYAKIVNDINDIGKWRNEKGEHPLRSSEKKDAKTVLRTIRSALAHGNVVYLDSDGQETPGNRVSYIALLDKHDDNVTHRAVIFDEEDFLLLVKRGVQWLKTFKPTQKFVFSQAA
jgi:hypothetical protein